MFFYNYGNGENTLNCKAAGQTCNLLIIKIIGLGQPVVYNSNTGWMKVGRLERS